MKVLLASAVLAALTLAPVGRATESPQAANDAEKLFRAMEAKVTGADAFHFRFQVEEETAQGKHEPSTGAVAVARGGKVYLEVKGAWTLNFQGKKTTYPIEVLTVSDGTQMKFKSWDPTTGEEHVSATVATPASVSRLWRSTSARTGWSTWLGVLFAVGSEEGAQQLLSLKASKFTLGPVEKVNGREARVIAYRLENPAGVGADCRVWIDTQTLLPLRRTMASTQEGHQLTETYSDFRVNAEVDPKLFVLP